MGEESAAKEELIDVRSGKLIANLERGQTGMWLTIKPAGMHMVDVIVFTVIPLQPRFNSSKVGQKDNINLARHLAIKSVLPWG